VICNYQFIDIVVAFLSFSFAACIYISCKDKDQQAICKSYGRKSLER
jgi:hypothetical protein